MSARRQINVRLPISLADSLAEVAKFAGLAQNTFIQKAIENEIRRRRQEDNEIASTMIVNDGHAEVIQPDPMLLRAFSDDKGFNIMEWVTDEAAKGEQTFNVGARIRGGTLRIIDTILAHPNCPYSTRSDFLRDALLTTAYIASKGRLFDERSAEFARRERAFLKEVAILERNRAQRQMLVEVTAALEDARRSEVGDFEYEQAKFNYETLARTIREHILPAYPDWTLALLRLTRSKMRDRDIQMLDLEFPEAIAFIREADSSADTAGR